MIWYLDEQECCLLIGAPLLHLASQLCFWGSVGAYKT